MASACLHKTTRQITDAATKGKVDSLIGLKKNVIIRKLIPAGTGMKKYRNVAIDVEAEDLDDDIAE